MKNKEDLSRKYRELLRRDLNKANRARLKNTEFSIISSNCVGGVITHELGLRFNSPTVNLFLYPKDYLKLIYHLHHYLGLTEIMEDKNESIQNGYPVGKLEDIKVYFVHYPSFEVAKNKWIERCQRVNWDNLFFIMTQRDGCENDDLLKFDHLPEKHKVLFTAQLRPDIKSSYYIKNSAKNNEVIDLNQYEGLLTGKRWIDEFDYVSFLNQT